MIRPIIPLTYARPIVEIEREYAERIELVPCFDHWHCDPATAAHQCTAPDRTKPCPACGREHENVVRSCPHCGEPAVNDLTCGRESCREHDSKPAELPVSGGGGS